MEIERMNEKIEIQIVDNGFIVKWRALTEVYSDIDEMQKAVKEYVKESQKRGS